MGDAIVKKRASDLSYSSWWIMQMLSQTGLEFHAFMCVALWLRTFLIGRGFKMSERYFNKEDFRRNMTRQVIKGYISDAVWETMQDMDFEQVSNQAFEKFFKTVEKIVRSEKLDNAEKIEKLLRLIKKYEMELY